MAALREETINNTLKKEGKKLFHFIRKRVNSLEDAEDIFQDTLFQLTNAFSTIDSLEKTSSWMFTVARNKITDLYRKKKGLVFSDFNPISNEDGESLKFEDFIPDMSSLPDDDYMRELIWESIMAALDELPANQREVFMWHEIEKKSFEEIVELTGEKQNTLMSRKRYAILHLRKRLADLFNEITLS